MFDPDEYTISIRKVFIDNENWFEAKVKELPYVAEYADSFDEAYHLAIDTIQTSMTMFAEKNKSFPPPENQQSLELSQIAEHISTTGYRDFTHTVHNLIIMIFDQKINTLQQEMDKKTNNSVQKQADYHQLTQMKSDLLSIV